MHESNFVIAREAITSLSYLKNFTNAANHVEICIKSFDFVSESDKKQKTKLRSA